MPSPRLGLFFALILSLSLVCGGCLFEPRVPEAPTGRAISYLAQSGPSNVVENLELAFKNTDGSGYDRQIGENFIYEPDSETQASYPGVDWEAWNREKEIAFIQDFFNTVSGVQVDLRAEIIYTDDSGDRSEHSYVYSMTVSSGGGTVPYRASVILEFQLEGTAWVLVRWFDEQGENDPDSGSLLPTLGQRRGAFAASGGGKASN